MATDPTVKRCDGCLYYVPLNSASGNCHRYPPTSVSSLWVLPVCQASYWCGEWVKGK